MCGEFIDFYFNFNLSYYIIIYLYKAVNVRCIRRHYLNFLQLLGPFIFHGRIYIYGPFHGMACHIMQTGKASALLLFQSVRASKLDTKVIESLVLRTKSCLKC